MEFRAELVHADLGKLPALCILPHDARLPGHAEKPLSRLVIRHAVERIQHRFRKVSFVACVADIVHTGGNSLGDGPPVRSGL